MTARIVAGIFARGGSKGVPRKNVRPLAGKPLIAYAIDVALRAPSIDHVFVSTDDEEIAAVARAHGADVPFLRPPELAGDDAPEWAAWQHAIRVLGGAMETGGWDAFVCVPTTSPLRAVEDVERCVTLFREGDVDVVATVRKAERSPYFNMLTLDAAGFARRVIEPSAATFRRQDAPTVFDMTTVAYVASPAFVLGARSMFEGRIRTVEVPVERALDIDTEFDFRLAELLMNDHTLAR